MVGGFQAREGTDGPLRPQGREIGGLRERLSRLSQASLRINESLDVGAARRNRVNRLRRKLEDDAADPRYIITKPR